MSDKLVSYFLLHVTHGNLNFVSMKNEAKINNSRLRPHKRGTQHIHIFLLSINFVFDQLFSVWSSQLIDNKITIF